MRCRPGIVKGQFLAASDQRCIASALHRLRDTLRFCCVHHRRLDFLHGLPQGVLRSHAAGFPTMTDFATARRMMVDGQVRTSDVTDLRIVAAMLELPRERFVPQGKAGLAYLDLDLPLTQAKPGQAARCLLKPMVLAKMVQAAAVGRAPAAQAMVYRCLGSDISGWPVFDAAAPLLPGFSAPAAFVF